MNTHRNTSITELLVRARGSIESGMTAWRAATEDMAAALDKGASKQEIADAV